ncbi:MAG: VTT domain-containing protein [Rhizobacter sp.]|nr:VTT domain-containing protein [Chlorobiales bacterium]
MEALQEFFSKLGSLDDLIAWGGLTVLFIVIFCETGLLVGFFLPGDALLITVGLVASRGSLNFIEANLVMILAAVLGDSAGYFIGKQLGTPLFERKESAFFRKDYLLQTKAFYEKHGGKTVFFGRFMPVVRSFVTTVAGIAGMRYQTFALFSISGAACWMLTFTSLGYLVGNTFPQLYDYINAVILVFLLLIPLSVPYHIWKRNRDLAKSEKVASVESEISQISTVQNPSSNKASQPSEKIKPSST